MSSHTSRHYSLLPAGVEPGPQAVVDVKRCIEKLLNQEGVLQEGEVRDICNRVKESLIEQANVISIPAPVVIVGDIRGDYESLLELFRFCGPVPNTNYLFLGNYVDRDHRSVETISLLVCLKLAYPARVNLLRGNLETRSLTKVYGFYDECWRKYGNARVWSYFTDLFDYLCLAAVVANSTFCVHAGVSPSALTIDQINVLERFQEIPPTGPMTDLLWSDPVPDPNDQLSQQMLDKEGLECLPVAQRHTPCHFGSSVVNEFRRANNMELIVRSHQLCFQGFQFSYRRTLCTIWSCPTYLNRCGNVGAVLALWTERDARFVDVVQRQVTTFSKDPRVEAFVPHKKTKGVADYFL
eukprot:gnl/Spiro4/24778_TR12318_c0_g1_i1.p1 gnl/Spiro4/24778_TR12318_c0_g1~~gnl/Spiro4/24778_TR12318_c0_g1_i1.p1  ORF type:complete len:353 (+),score=36.31 gnl/Spiro4/24778_TR12318_c0_g1_i1:82-1140(+)